MKLFTLITILLSVIFIYIYINFIIYLVNRLKIDTNSTDTITDITLILLCGILILGYINIFPIRITLIE
jgi:hypothetical protein